MGGFGHNLRYIGARLYHNNGLRVMAEKGRIIYFGFRVLPKTILSRERPFHSKWSTCKIWTISAHSFG